MQKELRLARDSVRGLKRIVPYRAARGEAGMDDRSPTFEPVMMVMMEDIGNSDRCSGAGRFNGRKGGMIVHNIVGEKGFVAPATAEIQSRRIIKSAGGSDSGEQKIVFTLPKTMLRNGQPGPTSWGSDLVVGSI
jgi:hypothetical protein